MTFFWIVLNFKIVLGSDPECLMLKFYANIEADQFRNGLLKRLNSSEYELSIFDFQKYLKAVWNLFYLIKFGTIPCFALGAKIPPSFFLILASAGPLPNIFPNHAGKV